MNVDGWSLLMALAVILLPLLLAGFLLARPTRNSRTHAPHSEHSNEKS